MTPPCRTDWQPSSVAILGPGVRPARGRRDGPNEDGRLPVGRLVGPVPAAGIRFAVDAALKGSFAVPRAAGAHLTVTAGTLLGAEGFRRRAERRQHIAAARA